MCKKMDDMAEAQEIEVCAALCMQCAARSPGSHWLWMLPLPPPVAPAAAHASGPPSKQCCCYLLWHSPTAAPSRLYTSSYTPLYPPCRRATW